MTRRRPDLLHLQTVTGKCLRQQVGWWWCSDLALKGDFLGIHIRSVAEELGRQPEAGINGGSNAKFVPDAMSVGRLSEADGPGLSPDHKANSLPFLFVDNVGKLAILVHVVYINMIQCIVGI